MHFFTRPVIKAVKNLGQLNEARARHATEVFFVYIGDTTGEPHDLYVRYQQLLALQHNDV